MEWNPDYLYRIRGTWTSRGNDQIIVFNLSNAVPAAFLDTSEDEEYIRKRRVSLCPEEWNDSFGEEFYDHTMLNDFYFLAPRSDWKAQAKSMVAPGFEQITTVSEEELLTSIENLRMRVGSIHAE